MEKRKYLEEIERTIQAGPYQDSWESLCQHVTPKWYKNDKSVFYYIGVSTVYPHSAMNGMPVTFIERTLQKINFTSKNTVI